MASRAAYLREWRAKRKAAGLEPYGYRSGHDHASYQRQRRGHYRAKGEVVGNGRSARFLDAPEFIFWDGEGATVEQPSGLPSLRIWEQAVKEHALAALEATTIAQAPFWDALDEAGGRLIPDLVRHRGRWVKRGEWADVPAHLLRANTARPAGGDAPGNLDQVTDLVRRRGLDVTTSDVLDFFREHPRRPSLREQTEKTKADLAHLYPQPGRHVYTIFANSRGDYITDPAGLSTQRCLDFLVATMARYPKARAVIFVGSYDVNMMLEALTREQAAQVYRAGLVPVTVDLSQDGTRHVYALSMRQRKSFSVARLGKPAWINTGTGRKQNVLGKAVLWDVWGFFQASFVGALRAWFSPAELVDLGIDVDAIAAMKAQRSTFRPEDLDEQLEYCLSECRAGEALVMRLAEHLREAGLAPARFDGAGACAGALLKARGVKDHIAEPPAHLRRGIATAYAGGRIELCQLGHHQGPILGHDIRSAYPAAAALLPTLHGRWVETEQAQGFALLRVRWEFDAAMPWYPLFYRRANGAILFPAVGEGWAWAPEVAAAQRFAAAYGGRVDILEGWRLEPEGPDPFGFVPELFATRARWKAEGRGAEKVLKLALNSIYGKTAQQLGGGPDRRPPFFSLAWAGFITSSTRARLVDAAMHDPDGVIAFATDGIFTERPLPVCEADGGLGTWEQTEPALEGVFVQAGVYWTRCAPCKKHAAPAWHAKFRGFDPAGMETPDHVLGAWSRGERAASVDVTRFVTLGSALASEDLWRYWRTWRTVPRALDLTGRSAKRLPVDRVRPAARGLVRLTPAWNVDYDAAGFTSAPYPVVWEEFTEDEPGEVDGVPAAVFEDEADAAAY